MHKVSDLRRAYRDGKIGESLNPNYRDNPGLIRAWIAGAEGFIDTILFSERADVHPDRLDLDDWHRDDWDRNEAIAVKSAEITEALDLLVDPCRYVEIAQIWRRKQAQSRFREGVVLIDDDRVYAWKNCLRDASNEHHGAIAVDRDGDVYRQNGDGNSIGTYRWDRIWPTRGRPG